MKFREGVTITRQPQQGYTLMYREKEKNVGQQQAYLVEALRKGTGDSRTFVCLIMKREGLNEAASGFILAEFIIEFGDFLEMDSSYYEIMD